MVPAYGARSTGPTQGGRCLGTRLIWTGARCMEDGGARAVRGVQRTGRGAECGSPPRGLGAGEMALKSGAVQPCAEHDVPYLQ